MAGLELRVGIQIGIGQFGGWVVGQGFPRGSELNVSQVKVSGFDDIVLKRG